MKAKSPEEFKKLLEESGGIEISNIDADTDDEDESILVNPNFPERSKDKSKPARAVDEIEPSIGQKSKMIGGKCAIELESAGRFSVPALVYFGDYDVDDINNVALSREEDTLHNIVVALDKQKPSEDWTVFDMTLEEFYETLVSIKYRFNSNIHIHRWMCNCQAKYPENQRKLSEFEIDLSTVQYISIQESEENLREEYREKINALSDEDFNKLLMKKYGNLDKSRDEEISMLKIKEPVMVIDEDKSYVFRFVRVKDMLTAMELGQSKFNWKIRQLKNKPVRMGDDEQIEKREEEIRKLEHEKAKLIVKAMKAQSLVEFCGNEIKSLDDKMEIFGQMSKTALFKFGKLMEGAKFGIHDEREFTCNICKHTEKRLLQRTISPIELFPVDDTDKSNTSGKSHFDPGFDIYFMP